MAEIVTHSHQDSFTGAVWRTYEWVGPLSESVEIRCSLSMRLPEMPFPLERKSIDWLRGVEVYYRTDAGLWYAWHRLLRAKDNTLNHWIGFRSRLIVTLTIWGVGHVEPGQIINWHCLRQKKPF